MMKEFRRNLREFKDNVLELPPCPSFLWKYYRPVKFLWQRLTRGFDDSCLWSLDYACIKWIYPRLKALRELPPHGVPQHHTEVYPEGHEYAGDPRILSEEEWDSILGEMLLGFKLVMDSDSYPLSPGEHDQLEKSMDVFREWFFALWD
jgi:hypothetical protein